MVYLLNCFFLHFTYFFSINSRQALASLIQSLLAQTVHLYSPVACPHFHFTYVCFVWAQSVRSPTHSQLLSCYACWFSCVLEGLFLCSEKRVQENDWVSWAPCSFPGHSGYRFLNKPLLYCCESRVLVCFFLSFPSWSSCTTISQLLHPRLLLAVICMSSSSVFMSTRSCATPIPEACSVPASKIVPSACEKLIGYFTPCCVALLVDVSFKKTKDSEYWKTCLGWCSIYCGNWK